MDPEEINLGNRDVHQNVESRYIVVVGCFVFITIIILTLCFYCMY